MPFALHKKKANKQITTTLFLIAPTGSKAVMHRWFPKLVSIYFTSAFFKPKSCKICSDTVMDAQGFNNHLNNFTTNEVIEI